jgi:DNA-binding NarL/FixJ family response regulator
MATRILIVDPDLQFTSRLKPAIEAAGDFIVRTCASGGLALDIVKDDPQDVAVLDFDVLGMPDLINWLREVQPGIYLLVTPRTASHAAQIADLNVQGSVTKPYFARQIVPVIIEAAAAKKRFEQQADQRKRDSHTLEPVSKIVPDETFRRMTEAGHTDTTKKRASSATPATTIPEPPLPDDATIGDLVSGQTTGKRTAQEVAQIADTSVMATPPSLPEATPAPVLEPALDADSPSVAMKALEVSTDDTPLDKVSVQAVVEQINTEAVETGHTQPGVLTQEVPSWAPTQDAVATNALLPVTPPPASASPAPIPSSADARIAGLAVQLTQLTVDTSARVTMLSRGEKLIDAAGQLPPEIIPDAFNAIMALWRRQQSEADDEVGKTLITDLTIPGGGDFLLFSTPTVDDMTLSMLFSADTSMRSLRRQGKEMAAALNAHPEPPAPPVAAAPPEPSAPTLDPAATSAEVAPALADVVEPSQPLTTLAVPVTTEAPSAASDLPATTEAPSAPPAALTGYGAVWLLREGETMPADVEAALRVTAYERGWVLAAVACGPDFVNVQIDLPITLLPMNAVDAIMQECAERLGYPADVLWEESHYIIPTGRLASEREIATFRDFHRDTQAH